MKLGAIERKLDLRDIKLGKVQAPVIIPEEYMPDHSFLPTYYQNGYPTCGAFAGRYYKTVKEHYENNSSIKFSGRFLWRMIKNIDNFPLEDGTDMRSIFKALRSKGICDDFLLPDVYSTIEEYSDPVITSEMYENAHPRIIGAYSFLENCQFSTLKQAIYQNKAVILLLYAGNDFWGKTLPSPTYRSNGHFVVADGYTKTHIRIKDSTEVNSSFSFKMLSESWVPYFREAGVAIELSNEEVKRLTRKLAILQEIVKIYYQLIALKNKK